MGKLNIVKDDSAKNRASVLGKFSWGRERNRGAEKDVPGLSALRFKEDTYHPDRHAGSSGVTLRNKSSLRLIPK